MSELTDLQASVANLGTAAASAEKALTDIATRLTALEGTGAPAPGVLEGLSTQVQAVATALGSAATAAEATP
jgi:hypothetical protein